MKLCKKVRKYVADPCDAGCAFLDNFQDGMEQTAYERCTRPDWIMWYFSFVLARTTDSVRAMLSIGLEMQERVTHLLPPEIRAVTAALVERFRRLDQGHYYVTPDCRKAAAALSLIKQVTFNGVLQFDDQYGSFPAKNEAVRALNYLGTVAALAASDDGDEENAEAACDAIGSLAANVAEAFRTEVREKVPFSYDAGEAARDKARKELCDIIRKHFPEVPPPPTKVQPDYDEEDCDDEEEEMVMEEDFDDDEQEDDDDEEPLEQDNTVNLPEDGEQPSTTPHNRD
jgi:hypothetical protein